MTSTLRYPIVDSSQPATARRRATALALQHGFGETAAGNVALVVTEAATNLVKHAGGGEILLRATGEGGEEPAIEVLALDKGRGMANVAQCQEDGYSTSGSPGTGLGGIARLSAFSDIYSQLGHGTAVFARLTRNHRPGGHSSARAVVGGVAVAKLGETACGDGWETATRRTGCVMVTVVDGLGHGPLAAEAAELAVRAFQAHAAERPRDVLEAMHVALHGSRGAAAAVAELDLERQLLTFAGVGNIAGAVISTGMRSMVSHNGIVGQIMPRVQEFTYPWSPHAVVVLHSDGVTAHWNLDAYPGLAHRHPTLVAGILYRDFTRGRDDATVVVVGSAAL